MHGGQGRRPSCELPTNWKGCGCGVRLAPFSFLHLLGVLTPYRVLTSSHCILAMGRASTVKQSVSVILRRIDEELRSHLHVLARRYNLTLN